MGETDLFAPLAATISLVVKIVSHPIVFVPLMIIIGYNVIRSRL